MPVFRIDVREHLNHEVVVEAPDEDAARTAARLAVEGRGKAIQVTTTVADVDATEVLSIDGAPHAEAARV